jgi:hypothetical protein
MISPNNILYFSDIYNDKYYNYELPNFANVNTPTNKQSVALDTIITRIKLIQIIQ